MSCNLKYIMLPKGVIMFNKTIAGIFLIISLNGCAQTSAFFGPAYTLAKSGSVYQAGLSYGSEKTITRLTGKSTGENIRYLLTPQKSDTEFEKLVKKSIKNTRKKLKLSQ